jgi:hypothetical protein
MTEGRQLSFPVKAAPVALTEPDAADVPLDAVAGDAGLLLGEVLGRVTRRQRQLLEVVDQVGVRRVELDDAGRGNLDSAGFPAEHVLRSTHAGNQSQTKREKATD